MRFQLLVKSGPENQTCMKHGGHVPAQHRRNHRNHDPNEALGILLAILTILVDLRNLRTWGGSVLRTSSSSRASPRYDSS